jgi:hypothetical protein
MTIISLVLSIIALLVSFLALSYTKQQADLMKRQQAREKEAQLWTEKFAEAVDLVFTIRPKQIMSPGVESQRNAYPVVFPDPSLRTRIESHLIRVSAIRSIPDPRQPTREQLGMPEMQSTIEDVLRCVKEFQQTNPGEAKQIGLV